MLLPSGWPESTGRPNRRRMVALSALIGVSWAAPAVFAQSRPEKAAINIAVENKAAFYCLALTLAEQLGFFRAEGLEVNIHESAPGTRPVQSAPGGVPDVFCGPYEQTIQLQSRNQFFQAFALHGRVPQVAIGVSTKTLPAYKSLSDLKGKKIGVTAPGSTAAMVASRVLSRAGIQAQEVSFVGVGAAGAAVAALRNGQIDAISNLDPVMTMLEQKGDVRIITDTRTLKGTTEVFGGAMPAGCLYAPTEFLQKNPATAQALANAMVHALKWLQTAGPGDIINAVPESYLLSDRGLYLAAFNKVRESIALDGLIPDDGAKVALRALASFDPGIKADKIVLAKTFTNEFARKAKEKFKA